MRNVKDRVVVITGASSGIGRAAARKYARGGAHLVLAARRKNALKELERECKELGVNAISIDTDVSDERSVRRLSERALAEFGRIDIWINNAGVATFGRFDEAPLKEHEQVIETNLLGTMYGTYYAVHHFRQRGEGILINVSSYDGRGAAPYHASYVASKHGVRGLGMSIRQELWVNNENNIKVCTVMPVSIDTPFFQHAANHMGKPVLPIPPVYSVEEAADTLYRLAMKPEDEVMVGRAGKFFGFQGKIAPKLTEKQMAYQTHRTEMGQDRTARSTSGNLFKAVREGTGESGGWLNRKGIHDLPGETNGMHNARTGKIAGGIIAVAAPAVLSWLLYNQRRSATHRQQPLQAA